MKSGFEIVEGVTSADFAVRIFGDTMVEILKNAAEALLSLLIENPESFQPLEKKGIVVEAETEEMLLYRFLDEIVFLKDARKLLCRIDEGEVVILQGSYVFRGTLWHDAIDFQRHAFNVDIKAVTLHGLMCVREREGYIAQVVFDV